MKTKYKELKPNCFRDIKIPLDFVDHPPRPEKLIRKVLAFWREGELSDIIVDENMVLTDGYCSYLISQQVGAEFVKIKMVKGEVQWINT